MIPCKEKTDLIVFRSDEKLERCSRMWKVNLQMQSVRTNADTILELRKCSNEGVSDDCRIIVQGHGSWTIWLGKGLKWVPDSGCKRGLSACADLSTGLE